MAELNNRITNKSLTLEEAAKKHGKVLATPHNNARLGKRLPSKARSGSKRKLDDLSTIDSDSMASGGTSKKNVPGAGASPVGGKGHKVGSVSSKSFRIVRSDSPTITMYDERPENDLDTSWICDSKLRTVEGSTRYQHDFDAKGLSLWTRLGRGTPLYLENMNGDLCYECAAQLNCMGGNRSTRLDHVILSLGKLYTQFEAWLSKFPSEHELARHLGAYDRVAVRSLQLSRDLLLMAKVKLVVGREDDRAFRERFEDARNGMDTEVMYEV
ncbi:hypothetical protein MMC22_009410 [Lobaria immixta]|nr:hypothetical protein [Lobaria immixta]